MLGATDPLSSEPGTIRGDYCVSWMIATFTKQLLTKSLREIRSLLVETSFTVPTLSRLLKRRLVCGLVRLVSSSTGLLPTSSGFKPTTKRICF